MTFCTILTNQLTYSKSQRISLFTVRWLTALRCASTSRFNFTRMLLWFASHVFEPSSFRSLTATPTRRRHRARCANWRTFTQKYQSVAGTIQVTSPADELFTKHTRQICSILVVLAWTWMHQNAGSTVTMAPSPRSLLHRWTGMGVDDGSGGVVVVCIDAPVWRYGQAIRH